MVAPSSCPEDPLVDGPVAEFRHPFTSTLGVYVAPLNSPYSEGTISLYLRSSSDSDGILALTAAHLEHRNTVLSHHQHREEIVALGGQAYEDAIINIMSRIGTFHEIKALLETKIRRLEQQQA